MSPDFDLAIVGGGVVGLTTATLAARRYPRARIAVLDKGRYGAGATLYAGAVDVPLAHTAISARRGRRSREIWLSELKDLFEAAFRPVPFYWLLRDSADHAQLASAHFGAPLLELGHEDWRDNLDQADLCRSRFPWTRRSGDVSTIDVARLTAGLVDAVYGAPNVIPVEAEAVTRWQSYDDHVTLSLGSGDTLCSARVIVSTGAWAIKDSGLTGLGLKHALRTKAVVGYRYKPLLRFGLASLPHSAFLFPTASGMTLSLRSIRWDTDPDATSRDSADEHVSEVEILSALCPALLARWKSRSHFVDAYARDNEAIVDAVAPNVVAALAASGSGVRLAPGIAEAALSQLDLS